MQMPCDLCRASGPIGKTQGWVLRGQREKVFKSLPRGSEALPSERFMSALTIPVSLLQTMCLSGSRRREGLSLGGVWADSCKAFLN